MNMAFNELSIKPLASNDVEVFKRVETFVHTYQKAQKEGFKGIRFHETIDKILLSPTVSLQDFCSSTSKRIYSSLILGLIRHPFVDENTAEEDEYINNNFLIDKDGEQLQTIGFAVAYLYNTICISLQSSEYWKKQRYNLHIEGNKDTHTQPLYHALMKVILLLNIFWSGKEIA